MQLINKVDSTLTVLYNVYIGKYTDVTMGTKPDDIHILPTNLAQKLSDSAAAGYITAKPTCRLVHL